MSDHNHWWTFCFRTPDPVFYFSELPCGTEPDDKEVGIEIARIVDENREHFRNGAGTCSPKEMPDTVEVPERYQRRLITLDELKAFRDSGGRPA